MSAIGVPITRPMGKVIVRPMSGLIAVPIGKPIMGSLWACSGGGAYSGGEYEASL